MAREHILELATETLRTQAILFIEEVEILAFAVVPIVVQIWAATVALIALVTLVATPPVWIVAHLAAVLIVAAVAEALIAAGAAVAEPTAAAE